MFARPSSSQCYSRSTSSSTRCARTPLLEIAASLAQPDAAELPPQANLRRFIAEGAATGVYLASSPEAEGLTGVYFEDGNETQPLEAALDGGAARRIWAEVERVGGRLRV